MNYTLEESRKKIKDYKDIYEINPKLEKKIKGLISKFIGKEYREEAYEILKKSNKETIKDFLFFALSDNGNLVCLTLEFAKDKKGKKIITKNFGNTEFFV